MNAIAIVISDIHLHDWSQFNKGGKRIEVSTQFIEGIFSIASKSDLPILFPGDLFHTPQGISTKLFFLMAKFFRDLSYKYKVVVYGIPGNHDISETSTIGEIPINLYSAWCNCFPAIFCDISYKTYVLDKFTITGIPYIDHNIGYTEFMKNHPFKRSKKLPNILLIHSDLYGAKDPSGHEINQIENMPRNLGRFFKDWDLVLAGHIHKPQKIYDKVIMIGAPYQQRKSDMDCDMGYWLIYDDLSTRFVKWNAPEFKTYNEGEEIPNDDNYWIPIPKEIKLKEHKSRKFSAKLDKTKIAKNYIRAKKIKSKKYKKALIEILTRTDD